MSAEMSCDATKHGWSISISPCCVS